MSDINKYTNRSGNLEYKENPFTEELYNTIKLGNKITGFASKSVDLLDKNSGEILGNSAFIGVKKQVDKEEFVKFYGAGLVSAFELTKTARDMFLMLMRVYLEADTTKAHRLDQIYINHAMAVDELCYNKTRQTFTNGLNQLIKKQFLAQVKYKKDWYWLNPNLFIKGDRITLIQQYEIKQDAQQNIDFDNDEGKKND